MAANATLLLCMLGTSPEVKAERALSSIGSRQIFTIGRSKTVPHASLTFTTRTSPSAPGCPAAIRPTLHLSGGRSTSFRSTSLPTKTFDYRKKYFVRCCS